MRWSIAPCLCTAALLASVGPAIPWRDRHSMPEGVSGGAVALISNKLVYAGGTTWRNQVKCWLTSTFFYDLQSDSWSLGPGLPEPLAYGAGVRTDHSLEVLGGIDENRLSRQCWRLDAEGQRWIESGVLPAGSVFGKAEIVEGQTYLFGGCADTELSRCSSSVLRRNHAGKWEKVSEMPQGPLAMPAIAVVEDHIYLFGGCSLESSGKVRNRDDAYRFDPRTNRWTALPPLPMAARGVSAAPMKQRYVLLAGGYVDPLGFSAAAYLYDTKDHQYKPVGSLPFPVMGMEMLARGSTIWGVGGEDRKRGRTARVIEAVLPE